MTEIELYQDAAYGGEPRVPNWRVIASAWAIALLIVVLFAGFDALASWRQPAMAQEIGAMIPRHNPACDAAAPAMPAKGCPPAVSQPLDSQPPWG
jgi:hypothetical protein